MNNAIDSSPQVTSNKTQRERHFVRRPPRGHGGLQDGRESPLVEEAARSQSLRAGRIKRERGTRRLAPQERRNTGPTAVRWPPRTREANAVIEGRTRGLRIMRPTRCQLRYPRHGVNEKTAPGSDACEAAWETGRAKSRSRPRNDRACALTGARGLVATTPAQHAEGRQLVARRV